MRVVAPSARLAPYLRDFMVVEVRQETTRVRLPEPGLVLGVRYSGAASVVVGGVMTRPPDVTLSAMMATARHIRTSAGSGLILARFRPDGAAQFFAQPLHQLHGSIISLDQVLPRADADALLSAITEATTDQQRVATLEAFLLARLRSAAPDAVVAAAVRAIGDAGGRVRIRGLARQLGISEDAFEKRFRRVVGASPKQLSSLLRLRRAVDTYRPGAPLSRLALDSGYFDQSHFHRELRAVTGEAPGPFLRAGRYR